MGEKRAGNGTSSDYRYPTLRMLIFSLILGGGSILPHFILYQKSHPDTLEEPQTSVSVENQVLQQAKNLSATERKYLDQLDASLADLRFQLKHHGIYSKMNSEENVKVFMNTHVFCVWDFMNLVKRLQLYFTSVGVPWRPVKSTERRLIRRLINEIVLEEETDELDGRFISHFSYYVDAIQQIQHGVISPELAQFFADISNESLSYSDIVGKEYLPNAVRKFLKKTEIFATERNIIVPVAAFTFGREVMLPEIFTSILEKSGVREQKHLSKFVNYLDRHIELDGDYHGYLSKKMSLMLVSSQEDWDVVIATAKTALEARLALWDEINAQLS